MWYFNSILAIDFDMALLEGESQRICIYIERDFYTQKYFNMLFILSYF